MDTNVNYLELLRRKVQPTYKPKPEPKPMPEKPKLAGFSEEFVRTFTKTASDFGATQEEIVADLNDLVSTKHANELRIFKSQISAE